MLDFPHAPSDRRRAHRPRHQVDRPRPVARWSPAASADVRRPSSPTCRTTRRPPGCPASAESTQALEKLEPFQDPDAIPTVVVYEARVRQLTDAEQFERRSTPRTRRARRRSTAVQGEAPGPFASEDGQAAQTLVTFNFGANGWKEMPDAAERGPRHRRVRRRPPSTSPGAGGSGRRRRRGLRGSRLQAAARHPRRGRHHAPPVHLPQPVLWILPIFSAVVALYTAEAFVYLLAKYADLTVNGQSRGDPDRARDRRRHRLRPAAGRPLSRGAAPPRGPARGDGLRAAPGGAGDPGQRRDRRASACSA